MAGELMGLQDAALPIKGSWTCSLLMLVTEYRLLLEMTMWCQELRGVAEKR